MSRKEIGAFAYRIKNDQLQIMLVTNREKSRWILPKGQPEEHMSDSEVALMEAYEEAGLIGEVDDRFVCHEVKLQTSRGKVKLCIYVVRIMRLLDNWPEKKTRKRELVRVKNAIGLVDKGPLKESIKTIAEKINALCTVN